MVKKILTLLICLLPISILGQELIIKKGIVVDSVAVIDSIPESFSLFIPSNFENKGKWPLLIPLDPKGRGKQAVSLFKQHAEEQGYILASPNNILDTLTLSENMLRIGRVLNSLNKMFPLHTNRIYMAGFNDGARLANLTPFVFKDIEGVISCGASITNLDLISKNTPFHFIGVVGKEDFSYIEMLDTEKHLNKLKFENNILVFDGGKKWPPSKHLGRAMHYFTLRGMAKGFVKKDSTYINRVFKENIKDVELLLAENKNLLANRQLKEIQNAFKDLINVDSVEMAQKELRKSKLFKAQKRAEESARFKELFLQDDYLFALEEDIDTYNYSNLGWWNYQMGELDKIVADKSKSQKQMGKRLVGFVNALIEDDLDMVRAQEVIDDEALIFLSMLKTITAPKEYKYYLDVISLSSKYEDYGTALFYLEEVLKNGFTDKKELYGLPDTALLKITPEFNTLVEKYLNSARYKINE